MSVGSYHRSYIPNHVQDAVIFFIILPLSLTSLAVNATFNKVNNIFKKFVEVNLIIF